MAVGTKLKMDGDVEEGMSRYEEAVVVCPSYAPAFYNMGVALSEAGDVRCWPISPSASQEHGLG